MKLRIKSVLAALSLFTYIFGVLFSANSATAAIKFPLIKITSRISIPDYSEVIDFARMQQGYIVLGIDINDRSILTLIDEKGSQIWRIDPLGIQEGFVTALSTSANRIFISGISQGALQDLSDISATPTPSASDAVVASPTPTPTPTPTATAPMAPDKKIPLVNPDNVNSDAAVAPREDLNNIFVAELDLSGKIISILNTKNSRFFLPTSVAANKTGIFLIGNEYPSENSTRGALYIFTNQEFDASYSYGEKSTRFNRVYIQSNKSLKIIGSSADLLSDKKVVGKVDAVILTVSATSGKIGKVLRSSGVKASRSWESGSGNLVVAGTSQQQNLLESVITQFSPTGDVKWTARYQNSNRAVIGSNCIALSLFGATKNLPFTPTGPEILLATIDGNGKILKGVRVAKEQIIAVAPTFSKGCAALTYSPEAGARLSYL
jgi:hypothetical protein